MTMEFKMQSSMESGLVIHMEGNQGNQKHECNETLSNQIKKQEVKLIARDEIQKTTKIKEE